MVLYNIIPRKREARLKRFFDEPFGLINKRTGGFFDDFFDNLETKIEAFSPRMDITEDQKEVLVTIELPGVSRKDIHMSLEKDHLTIKGEKKEEHVENEEGYKHIERSYGSFQRKPFALFGSNCGLR